MKQLISFLLSDNYVNISGLRMKQDNWEHHPGCCEAQIVLFYNFSVILHPKRLTDWLSSPHLDGNAVKRINTEQKPTQMWAETEIQERERETNLSQVNTKVNFLMLHFKVK